MIKEQAIADLVVDRLRTAEEKIEGENEKWQEFYHEENRLYAKLEQSLPKEYQEDFKNYCEATYCAWAEKTGCIYQEGVKDGIRLMKAINKV